MAAKVTAPTSAKTEMGYAFDLAYSVELRDYFQTGPASTGVRSSFGTMLAQLEGCQLGGGSVESRDPYAEVVDKLSRHALVERTLRRIEPWHATVLRRYFDAPSPAESEWTDFGPMLVAGVGLIGGLASLVPLTREAHELRDEMAAQLGERRAERCSDADADRVRKERRDEIAALFWAEAAARAEAAAKHDRLVERLDRWQAKANDGQGLSAHQQRVLADGDAKLRELARRVRAGDDWLASLLSAYADDGRARSAVSAVAGADAEVSVHDAVRRMLRRKRGDEERVRFVANAKLEAQRLRKAAHAAYKLARYAIRAERVEYRMGANAWHEREESGDVA